VELQDLFTTNCCCFGFSNVYNTKLEKEKYVVVGCNALLASRSLILLQVFLCPCNKKHKDAICIGLIYKINHNIGQRSL